MSDDVITPEVPVTELAPAPEVEQPKNDDLPKWARDKLSKANDEAASYRLKAKEAREVAEQAVKTEFEAKLTALSDEKAAIEAELSNSQLKHLKLTAALSAGIPGESVAEFAELLQGTTAEEITAHAEKVKSLMGVQPAKPTVVDRSQGLGGAAQTPTDGFRNFILNQLK